MYNLIVTAHPDDESIFMAGLILSKPKADWVVVCVTDGNADGNGPARKMQLQKACKMLGVAEFVQLDFPDVYEHRLSVTDMAKYLREFKSAKNIYTHGPLGEYGHPHHQDVCMAAHEVFAEKREVMSIAYNCLPDMTVKLSPEQYKKKCRILSEIYAAETRRFVNFLPAGWFEGFSRVSLNEVWALYRYFTQDVEPSMAQLKKYRWYWPYLKFNNAQVAPRPF